MGDIPPVPDLMSDLAQQAGMSDSAKESAERDARWIGDFADDLNVAIALREWDRAVELVEQGVFLPAAKQRLTVYKNLYIINNTIRSSPR
jgi:hypothetical protein